MLLTFQCVRKTVQTIVVLCCLLRIAVCQKTPPSPYVMSELCCTIKKIRNSWLEICFMEKWQVKLSLPACLSLVLSRKSTLPKTWGSCFPCFFQKRLQNEPDGYVVKYAATKCYPDLLYLPSIQNAVLQLTAKATGLLQNAHDLMEKSKTADTLLDYSSALQLCLEATKLIETVMLLPDVSNEHMLKARLLHGQCVSKGRCLLLNK